MGIGYNLPTVILWRDPDALNQQISVRERGEAAETKPRDPPISILMSPLPPVDTLPEIEDPAVLKVVTQVHA
jgi:hypothetical protein